MKPDTNYFLYYKLFMIIEPFTLTITMLCLKLTHIRSKKKRERNAYSVSRFKLFAIALGEHGIY